MKDVLLHKSDPLNGACRAYFNWLQQYVSANQIEMFGNSQMSLASRKPPSTIKRYHKDLADHGYLRMDKLKKSRSNVFLLTGADEYENLRKSVDEAMDAPLHQIRKLEKPSQ